MRGGSGNGGWLQKSNKGVVSYDLGQRFYWSDKSAAAQKNIDARGRSRVGCSDSTNDVDDVHTLSIDKTARWFFALRTPAWSRQGMYLGRLSLCRCIATVSLLRATLLSLHTYIPFSLKLGFISLVALLSFGLCFHAKELVVLLPCGLPSMCLRIRPLALIRLNNDRETARILTATWNTYLSIIYE